jgi:hypothetical protein
MECGSEGKDRKKGRAGHIMYEKKYVTIVSDL